MPHFVSIIVPVYNAEDYLDRCIESIRSQEYKNFELILVDDGSTDRSGVICDRHAADDERVHVIHKVNSGVSDSRNQAIDQAKGEYLQFVDSDDWLAPNATKLMVDAAVKNDCDLIITDFYRVSGSRLAQKGDIDEEEVMDQETFAGHMMENPADFYYGVLWNKLYRRDIVETYHIRMDEKISWCEDFMFNLEYIRHAQRILAIPIPVYYYLKRKGSLVNQNISISRTIKMKLTVFEYYNNFYKHIFDSEDYEKNRLQVYRFLVDSAGDGTVPPSIFPSSKKLGKERIRVCAPAVDGEGAIRDHYRRRKLLEYYMENPAKKYELNYLEIRILMHLSGESTDFTRSDLADFIGVSRSSLALALKTLSLKGYIKVEDAKNKKEDKNLKKIHIHILPQADPVMDEIEEAYIQYEQSMFEGFSEEELETYGILDEKIKHNIQRILTQRPVRESN